MKKLFGKLLSLLVLACGVTSYGALVDDFDSYTAGNIKDGVTGGVWTAIDNTSFATVVAGDDSQYLKFGGYASGYRGCYTSISPVADDSTAVTLFTRVYAEADAVNHSFGLTDLSAPSTSTGFGSYEVQLALLTNDTANSVDFAVRNGSNVDRYAISTGQWYNVWAVIDQSTDTFSVYLTTGTDSASASALVFEGVSFRNGTSDSLVTFLAYGGYTSNNVRLDDIYISEGADLSYPVPEPATCVLTILGMGVFIKRRKG